jgi:hypothetical protein
VCTLDALLRVRQDMILERLFIHIGDALIERLAGYAEGYRACMRENRLPDDSYERFRGWLRHTKQKPPVEENPARYLQEGLGDPERAIRKYLDLVADFIASHPEESKPRLLPERAGKPTALLPYLLQIRQDMQQGRLHAHLGDVNAERFNTFVDGYNACLEYNGLSDEEYAHFRDWLRDVKQEIPAEGWPAGYLRDCQGDHARAIRKYLDFVAEFAA